MCYRNPGGMGYGYDLVKTGVLLSKRLSSFQASPYLMFFQSHVKDSLGETRWGSRLHHRDQMS